MLQSKGLNESEEEAVLLQMGIISEKDIHDHDGNVSIVPAPPPAPVAVNPKADDNNDASANDAVVMESASSQTAIAAYGGDGVSGAVKDSARSATSSSPSDADRGGVGVNTETTKAAAAAAEKAKAKSPMLEQIIEANVQTLGSQYQPQPGGGGETAEKATVT